MGRWHQVSRDAVRYRLADTPLVNRPPAVGGLDNRQSEALLQTRVNVAARRRIVLRQVVVGHEAREFDLVSDTQLTREGFQSSPLRPVSYDDPSRSFPRAFPACDAAAAAMNKSTRFLGCR